MKEETIHIILSVILKKYKPDSIWLYGSMATDKLRFGFMKKKLPKEDSDIDINIKMPEGMKIMRHDYELNTELTKACGVAVNVVFSTKQNAWMETKLWPLK